MSPVLPNGGKTPRTQRAIVRATHPSSPNKRHTDRVGARPSVAACRWAVRVVPDYWRTAVAPPSTP